MMQNISWLSPMRVRTVWISDVHLGYRGCSADRLLDFLHSTQCETLYLVGDIIDVLSMKRGLFWPQSHNNVIRAILGKAKRGTRVVFVPGNHDEIFRDHAETQFGNLRIVEEAVHETRDGRRLLIVHGDRFDGVIVCNPWLAKLGGHVYDFLLAGNRYLDLVRRRLGMDYWSLTGSLKRRVKNAKNYITSFEEAVAWDAKRDGFDGVICGHIHHAGIREIDGIIYHNCGDWVESNTAIVEHFDGGLELMHWDEVVSRTALADLAEPVRRAG